MRLKRKIHWAIVLLIESVLVAAFAAVVALTEWLPIVISNICLWGVYPLAAAFAAYVSTRCGVNNYIAWIPAPVLGPAIYYLIWGFLASPGPMFISALLGIIGAAAGETKNQFERRKR